MNKIRIIGLLFIITGFIVKFAFKNGATGFISGLLFGTGIGLLSRGKFGETKKE